MSGVTEMIRDLNELNPKVKELAQKLLDECKKKGMNIGISETYRTVERQNYLYAQGRTRSGAIITYTKGSEMQSYHQWRLAFDVYNNVVGSEYDSNILKRVGAIGQKLGLEWGGSWSGFSDTPHFQYTFGLSINDLKNGKKPPEDNSSSKEDNTIDAQKQYLQAIDYFVEQKIMDTISLWKPNPTLKYTEALIIKIGKSIFKVDGYTNTIKKCIDIKIINTPEVWYNKNYIEEQVKVLLTKIYQYANKK